MATDFQRGARAMFDCLMERAANNFHANPVIKEACEKENAIIEKWAADALETVDPVGVIFNNEPIIPVV